MTSPSISNSLSIGFLCISESWGGLEMNNIKLGKWLAERGHTIYFINGPQAVSFAEAGKNGLTALPIHIKGKFVDLGAAMTIRGFAKTYKFDALIVGLSKDIGLGALAKVLSGNSFKLIYLQQMSIGVNKRDILHTFIYKNLDAWIAPLNLLKQQVLEKTRVPERKIHQIPLCIDVEAFSNPGIAKKEAREKLGLPQDKVIVGMMGRADEGKGHRYFIESIKIVRDKGYEVQGLILGLVTVFGRIVYTQEMEELRTSLGLEALVHFRDFSPIPQEGYQAMDLYVMASLEEAFGMVTVEAMASGLPVIGTSNLGPKEILEDGKYGYMVPIQSAERIADGIVDFLENREQWSNMAEFGKSMVARKYSKSVMSAGIESLINKH